MQQSFLKRSCKFASYQIYVIRCIIHVQRWAETKCIDSRNVCVYNICTKLKTGYYKWVLNVHLHNSTTLPVFSSEDVNMLFYIHNIKEKITLPTEPYLISIHE